MTRSISTGAYVLRLTLTLFLITTIVAGLLGLVNYVTADTIAEQIAQKAENAMRQVLEADSYEPLDVPEDSAVTAADNAVIYPGEGGAEGCAVYGCLFVGKGGAVTGVAIVSQSETASLGANCTREDFRAQFTGKTGTLSVSKDGGEIEALTGATVTSRAVTEGVNTALEFVQEVLK